MVGLKTVESVDEVIELCGSDMSYVLASAAWAILEKKGLNRL
jgi:hypothetical protein